MIQFRFSNWTGISIIINRKFRNVNLISARFLLFDWTQKHKNTAAALLWAFPRSQKEFDDKRQRIKVENWSCCVHFSFVVSAGGDDGNAIVGYPIAQACSQMRNGNYNYKLRLLYAIEWNISSFTSEWMQIHFSQTMNSVCCRRANHKWTFNRFNLKAPFHWIISLANEHFRFDRLNDILAIGCVHNKEL